MAGPHFAEVAVAAAAAALPPLSGKAAAVPSAIGAAAAAAQAGDWRSLGLLQLLKRASKRRPAALPALALDCSALGGDHPSFYVTPFLV